MEWQVRIKDRPHLVDLPSYLVANTVISAKIDGRTVLLRWNPLHQTFFISEAKELLEHCFRIRNYSVEIDPQTDEKRIRFHLSGKDATVVEAVLNPLSHSRAIRSKTKKKRVARQFSPLTGKVLKLYVKPGDTIRRGEQVAIIEAMKMENKILSEMTGIVKTVSAVEQGKINMGEEIFSTSPLKT